MGLETRENKCSHFSTIIMFGSVKKNAKICVDKPVLCFSDVVEETLSHDVKTC